MADHLKRRPPAYQVYAADDLASSKWYGLSAGERGLLETMQRACWIDDTVPNDLRLLARVLRLGEGDVLPFLTPAVLAFFVTDEADPSRLRSAELHRQMANIKEIRAKQSKGGRDGAAITNGARNGRQNRLSTKDIRPTAPPLASQLAGRPAIPELSRNELSRVEVSQKQSVGRPTPYLIQIAGGSLPMKRPKPGVAHSWRDRDHRNSLQRCRAVGGA